ncbi:putative acyl esterase [Bradyrhizobium sp. USDA 4354]
MRGSEEMSLMEQPVAADPHRVERRDGMIVEWDVPIAMDDGVVLRADVFRPPGSAACPVIMSYGPYAKGLSFQQGYPSAWQQMVEQFPEVTHGSSGLYQNWEVVDPERWVPDGYACVRVDGRGAGRSPGHIEPWSGRESRDFYACIEWAAARPWSNGKVGLNGISYYGMNQWQVASLRPPHLAAICVWEGAADFYRDVSHHGGIYCTFLANWYRQQVTSVQHGLGRRGPRSVVTGDLVCGPETLDADELAASCSDLGEDVYSRPLWDPFYQERSAQWDQIDVPLLSAANWGGNGLHLRGNIEGFLRAASKHKWLEIHGREHWTEFYSNYGVDVQKRFFDHFLKGEANGWDKEPPVQLWVRHVDRFEPRSEQQWPIARTEWRKLFLNCSNLVLLPYQPELQASHSYDGLGDGATFLLPAQDRELEITGPLAAKLFVSSETTDADLFLVLRLFSPDMKEVVFQGALDPHTPIAQGWLRASHRKLDPRQSTIYRPYHPHYEIEPLQSGRIYELDIEIWPTSIVVPAGYRLALTVRGKDYEYSGPSARLSNIRNEMRGCGPFLHDDPRDRPASIFGGRVTLHTGPACPSHLLVPIVPTRTNTAP